MSENEQKPNAQANAAADSGQAPETQFALQRIYVKDLSFESPRAPVIYQEEWKPKVKMDINTGVTRLKDDNFEVVLTVTLTVGSNDQTAYLVEVQQAGLFLIRGLEQAALERMLGAYCPSLLFPYAREAVDNLVLRGNFPPMHLAPINFDAVFNEAIRRQQEQQSQQGGQAESQAH